MTHLSMIRMLQHQSKSAKASPLMKIGTTMRNFVQIGGALAIIMMLVMPTVYASKETERSISGTVIGLNDLSLENYLNSDLKVKISANEAEDVELSHAESSFTESCSPTENVKWPSFTFQKAFRSKEVPMVQAEHPSLFCTTTYTLKKESSVEVEIKCSEKMYFLLQDNIKVHDQEKKSIIPDGNFTKTKIEPFIEKFDSNPMDVKNYSFEFGANRCFDKRSEGNAWHIKFEYKPYQEKLFLNNFKNECRNVDHAELEKSDNENFFEAKIHYEGINYTFYEIDKKDEFKTKLYIATPSINSQETF